MEVSMSKKEYISIIDEIHGFTQTFRRKQKAILQNLTKIKIVNF